MDKHTELPSVAQRFLRYVGYDTQSDEASSTRPSSARQLKLLRLLVEELQALGLSDAHLDDHSYVIASVPSNVAHSVPTIGLIAHVDTSPEMTGADVKPQIHPNYQGGPIKLNAEYQLTPEQSPELATHHGHTIITSDGTTLLGADNKAGVASIITLVERLLRGDVRHGPLRIAFTYDEEIGRGTETFDVEAFGAKYAYTVDGETVGHIENETFCADSAVITCHGVNVHPGYAKGRMVNALKVAAEIVARLPAGQSPEATDGREGYIHPVAISGGVEQATVKLILRDFELEKLAVQHQQLLQLAREAEARFAGAKVEVVFEESYRNMRLVLDQHPEVVELAIEATRRAGLEPKLSCIRGGTDGAALSFRGLPTPNIFTGGHLFHSRFEWVAVEAMQATVDTLTELVSLWAERSA
ncbi:MAG: peptidase T [Deltaproteobacteria bacterium]|nr:peptidase T [Deltaproteobacteria bacterium]